MVEKKIPVLYVNKEECSGCSACYTICPRNAIFMLEDKEGFCYPIIDENKCICCYSCVKICPIKSVKDAL